MNANKIKLYEEWLDEIYLVVKQFPENEAMKIKYNTSLRAVEILGGDWTRSEKGLHKIFMF